MKWFGRFCWLLVWVVWVWLGFGLHRELPRELGPKVCELPRKGTEIPVGFIGNTSLIAVQMKRDLSEIDFQIFDGRDGSLVRKIKLAERFPNGRRLHRPITTCRSHGVVFATSETPPRMDFGRREIEPGFFALDLAKGEWKRIFDGPVFQFDVHPTKPWVAFTETFPPLGRTRKIAVVDWTTGEELLVRPPNKERPLCYEAIFLGDSDKVVIPVWPSIGRAKAEPLLEVWRIGSPSRLEKSVELPWFGGMAQGSSSGRLAWINSGPNSDFDVFDLESERMLISRRPPEEREPTNERGYIVTLGLSKSGRSVMGGRQARLWSVDTGKTLWSRDADQTSQVIEGGNAFTVVERWEKPWTGKTFGKWNTVALRDLETGAVTLRCWEKDASALRCTSADGTLAVTERGVVHQFPLRVNWPILALCQSILALPIILFWTFLRWRRKRRLQRRKMLNVE